MGWERGNGGLGINAAGEDEKCWRALQGALGWNARRRALVIGRYFDEQEGAGDQ